MGVGEGAGVKVCYFFP